MFQEKVLFPHLSILQNVKFGICGSSNARKNKALEFLRLFKVDQYAKEINIPRFNYLEHLKKYETFISNNSCINSDLSEKLETFYPHLEDFQNQGWEPVLCHHDLSTFNIIKTINGLRIIDWEYSAYGHACFDKEYTRLSKSKDNFFNNLFGILDEMWSLINKI